MVWMIASAPALADQAPGEERELQLAEALLARELLESRALMRQAAVVEAPQGLRFVWVREAFARKPAGSPEAG